MRQIKYIIIISRIHIPCSGFIRAHSRSCAANVQYQFIQKKRAANCSRFKTMADGKSALGCEPKPLCTPRTSPRRQAAAVSSCWRSIDLYRNSSLKYISISATYIFAHSKFNEKINIINIYIQCEKYSCSLQYNLKQCFSIKHILCSVLNTNSSHPCWVYFY